MILKQKNNLKKNLILKVEFFQEKVDLVKLENVLVNLKNLIYKTQIKFIISILINLDKAKPNLISPISYLNL